jgi:hypothetical protein
LYRELVTDSSFFVALCRLDEEIAAEVRSRGCECGGALHVSNYVRRPQGLGFVVGGEHALRLSFCCAREGCRRRVTPPSVRFFGRRHYAAVVFVLVSALLTERLSEALVGRIEFEIGVSLETLKRWRRWWRQTFARSRFWQWRRGRFSPPVEECGAIAGAILARFGAASDRGAVRRLLHFLSPLTTASWAETAMAGG